MAEVNLYIGHRDNLAKPPISMPKVPTPLVPGEPAKSDCRLYREWMKPTSKPFDGNGKSYKDIIDYYVEKGFEEHDVVDIDSFVDNDLQGWPSIPLPRIGKEVLDGIKKDWEKLKQAIPDPKNEKLNRGNEPQLPSWFSRTLTFDISLQDEVDGLFFLANGSLSRAAVTANTEDSHPIAASSAELHSSPIPLSFPLPYLSPSATSKKTHLVRVQMYPRFTHSHGDHSASWDEEEENLTLDLVHVCLVNTAAASSKGGAHRGLLLYSPKNLPRNHPVKTGHLGLTFSTEISIASSLKKLNAFSITSQFVMTADVDLPKSLLVETAEFGSAVGTIDLTSLNASALSVASAAGSIHGQDVSFSESVLAATASGDVTLNLGIWENHAISLFQPATVNISVVSGNIDLSYSAQPRRKVLETTLGSAAGRIDVKHVKEWEGTWLVLLLHKELSMSPFRKTEYRMMKDEFGSQLGPIAAVGVLQKAKGIRIGSLTRMIPSVHVGTRQLFL
ncbi:hypothetical protein BT69DRAFT_1000751 [Atractiella rhizophila]|nr:hypothetical protein BT69DRAFT_1000751 [Atractiella rhizophila]